MEIGIIVIILVFLTLFALMSIPMHGDDGDAI